MSARKAAVGRREVAPVESERWRRLREWCIAVMREAQAEEEKQAS